jgi:hypothetical protein
MDGTPDNDHGANSVNTLQSMLLQSDGDKILLLPAWPEDWDVSFKLCAAGNTTVECTYRDGKVRSLKVTPESRLNDVTDMTTLQQRIRNLVEVALSDHNYLFGLPPMLDALPVAGKTTGPWISGYGHTLSGCKAGPWPNSVFKGNTVYVHITRWPEGGVQLPLISRKLMSSKSITGNLQVTRNAEGWRIAGTPDPVTTIAELVFDAPLDDIAYGLPSQGSLTTGCKWNIMPNSGEGLEGVAVDLKAKKSISRFEFTITNPGYLRGQGKPFELQALQKDGEWTTIYKGNIYGTICGKQIDPVSARHVRLMINAQEIKQFDVFEN